MQIGSSTDLSPVKNKNLIGWTFNFSPFSPTLYNLIFFFLIFHFDEFILCICCVLYWFYIILIIVDTIIFFLYVKIHLKIEKKICSIYLLMLKIYNKKMKTENKIK